MSPADDNTRFRLVERMVGRADLSVIRRYLAQTEGDLSQAYAKAAQLTICCEATSGGAVESRVVGRDRATGVQ